MYMVAQFVDIEVNLTLETTEMLVGSSKVRPLACH
jgi:hypothetical protein